MKRCFENTPASFPLIEAPLKLFLKLCVWVIVFLLMTYISLRRIFGFENEKMSHRPKSDEYRGGEDDDDDDTFCP